MASNHNDIQEKDYELIFPKIISSVYWLFLRQIYHVNSRIQLLLSFLFFSVIRIGNHDIEVKRMIFDLS